MTDTPNLMDLWQNGSPLDHAWFHFASEEMKEQYRSAKTEQSSSALQCLMQGEVQEFLACGKLRAIGIALPLIPSGAPDVISHLLFAADGIAIDWGKSIIQGLGCHFDAVRVIRARRLETANKAPQPQEFEASQSNYKIGKGGRKDTYAYSATVLAALHESKANRDLSAERLHPAFAVEFGRQFTAIPAPSIRTLREQLKRFRQETAETGNNQNSD